MAAEPQSKEAAIQPAENRGQNKKWSDLFWSSSKPSKVFQLRKWNEEDRVIAKDELRNLGYCLVAYILGRFPGRMAVENVQKSWNVDSTCSRHESGWLIFRFHSEEDRDLVLLKGPFETLGAPWLMKKLPPFFKFDEGSLCSVPTWVRMKGLPLECWTVNALGKLASFVGEPLAADECTASMSKTSFARILVEVDVTRPLVREISTILPDGSRLVQEVVYEREPQLCSKCKRIGHNAEHCRMQSGNKKPRTAQLQQAEHSQHNLQIRTEQPPVTNAAGDNLRPSTSAVVAVELLKRLPGKKVQKEPQVAEEHQSSAAALPQILQASADSDVMHQSVACQHEDQMARTLPAKKVQQQAEAHGSAVTILQSNGSPTGHLQTPADSHPMILHEDQMCIADQVLDEAKHAQHEADFPPLAAGETGIKKMQTRKASAANLAAATAKKLQQQPELQPSALIGVDALTAATTADHCIAGESCHELEDTQMTEHEAVLKQPAGPKWRQNRKTRSAAKKRGSAS